MIEEAETRFLQAGGELDEMKMVLQQQKQRSFVLRTSGSSRLAKRHALMTEQPSRAPTARLQSHEEERDLEKEEEES